MPWLSLTLFAMIPLAGAEQPPSAEAPLWTQTENVVYAEAHGVGLLMDIFTPTGKKNGLAIIDVVSGSYSSNSIRLKRHKQTGLFDMLCKEGYTVFAVRPGSQPRFVIGEMVDHIEIAIRWVKANAKKHEIDPDRLGLLGASAGGHLAALVAVTPEPGKPDDPDPMNRFSTEVAAVVTFFPPTDMLQFGYRSYDASNIMKMPKLIMQFVFFQGKPPRRSPEEMLAIFASLSPARLVQPDAPPFLIIHGDADIVVPVQQAHAMHGALKNAGVKTELVILEGIGHGYAAMGSQIHRAADWFNDHLVESQAQANR